MIKDRINNICSKLNINNQVLKKVPLIYVYLYKKCLSIMMNK